MSPTTLVTTILSSHITGLLWPSPLISLDHAIPSVGVQRTGKLFDNEIGFVFGKNSAQLAAMKTHGNKHKTVRIDMDIDLLEIEVVGSKPKQLSEYETPRLIAGTSFGNKCDVYEINSTGR